MKLRNRNENYTDWNFELLQFKGINGAQRGDKFISEYRMYVFPHRKLQYKR